MQVAGLCRPHANGSWKRLTNPGTNAYPAPILDTFSIRSSLTRRFGTHGWHALHLYSPGTNLERSELAQLETATRTVDLAMYSFTDRELAGDLAALAHKGVRVQVRRNRDGLEGDAMESLPQGNSEPNVSVLVSAAKFCAGTGGTGAGFSLVCEGRCPSGCTV